MIRYLYRLGRLLIRILRPPPSVKTVLERFEQQYRCGAWDRLSGNAELSRYSIIVGYCNMLRPESILDVGCGQGILAKRLKSVGYRRYLGIDFSSEAILQAQSTEADERTCFAIADATNANILERFDLIIFNECLYYFDHPYAVTQHYVHALSGNGRIIVSMYKSFRNRMIWRM